MINSNGVCLQSSGIITGLSVMNKLLLVNFNRLEKHHFCRKHLSFDM